MKISNSITLKKLGFRQKSHQKLRDLFGPPEFKTIKKHPPIQPDVDYHPEEERIPQAPNFSSMWIDEFSNIGNTKNPLASPMESGA